ncbi:MAG: hypothetical protein IPH37_11885 [Burkholderiales bacterium]|nr:hypothetical protein [Burkholderiales bacterium]
MQAHTIQWGASGTALLLCATNPAHHNAQGLVWLQLEDGAVRAFRLPVGACHGAALNALAEQCAQDADGKVLEFALKPAPQRRRLGLRVRVRVR